jgi:DNA-binding MarR family transcriptional regulator
VLDRLLALAGRLHGRMAEIAADHDLTPQQAKLLRLLDEPCSMGSVAEVLACDPSNVTGLIARIEGRGLVERAPDPTDRRVRLLVLTPAGREVSAVLDADLVGEAATLSRLDRGEIAQLVALLDRVAIGGAGGGCAAPWP